MQTWDSAGMTRLTWPQSSLLGQLDGGWGVSCTHLASLDYEWEGGLLTGTCSCSVLAEVYKRIGTTLCPAATHCLAATHCPAATQHLAIPLGFQVGKNEVVM